MGRSVTHFYFQNLFVSTGYHDHGYPGLKAITLAAHEIMLDEGDVIVCAGVVYFQERCHHLKRTNGRAGVQMLCGGGGVGIATVVERV